MKWLFMQNFCIKINKSTTKKNRPSKRYGLNSLFFSFIKGGLYAR